MRTSFFPLLAGLLLAGSLHAAPIRLEGGMVAVHDFLAPHRAAVEQSTGQALAIKGSTSTKGLIALSRGECDVSVTAVPLELLIEEAHKGGTELQPTDFTLHILREDRLVFIVHPETLVSRLSMEQLQGLYMGSIKNWKEVGGADLPVAVYTDQAGSGTSTLLRSMLLKGAAMAGNHLEVSNLKLVANSVSTTKGSIGAVSSGFVDPAQVKEIETVRFTRPIGLITRGAPSAEILQVIEAYKALLK